MQTKQQNKTQMVLGKTYPALTEKHIPALNIKHECTWLNLKEMLPLCSHLSHFLVSNYPAPLKAFSSYVTATEGTIVPYPSLIQNENKYLV